ncbi:Retrovirus-related Pol polyprotein, partial [Mucuna pruriens]
MFELGASINVMSTSVYKSLNFGDLEPIGMAIQLANRSLVQPLGVLEDVLVQVNELIFPADFYVLDMEDETSGKGSTLILGRPFLMTARTKIDVHAWMLSMEFGDNLVQFNIFEAMKHPTEDHSLFGIDVINKLVAEHLQLEANSTEFPNFTKDIDVIGCLGSVTDESDYDKLWDVQDLSDFEDDTADFAHLDLNSEFEEKLLQVLRQHKKAIGWQLSDLPGINPSICMHRILMEEEARPIRQRQRRLNLTILDVVKKKVTKLLASGIIYPISDSKWVNLVQVIPKKSGMTVMKNQHDELVPMWIQNSWRVCIDYRKLNQATCKDHFRSPFIDQFLKKLTGKSHYCFLDGLSRYMQIHIALEDQHKTTFTCPFGTFAYTRMSFGLFNASSTFQCCMTSIFLDLLQDCMEDVMDDITVYAKSFDACLENLSRVLTRCMNTNIVLNFENAIPCRGIEVDKSKIDIITSLPNPTSVREVRSFLRHAGFLGTEDLTYIHTNSPSTQLGVSIRANVSRIQLYTRSRLGPTSWSRQAVASGCEAKTDSVDASFQKFDIEIKDKKGAENSVAGHLSRIERESYPMPIRDEFPDEQLLQLNKITPWFADIYASELYKAKLESDAKYYIWDDPYLWKLYSDQVIRRCIPDSKIKSVLHFFHSTSGGGHCGSTRIVRKVLHCGFYWPTIFKSAHQFSIDFMGPFLVSNRYSYILLAVDYVSGWVEAIATKTNDAKVVVDFLKSNIFYRFGVPKALISDQGSHFYNRVIMGWCIEWPQHITPRQTTKLKCLIGKSRKFCKRWPIPTRKTRADSLKTLYGHTELHTGLR